MTTLPELVHALFADVGEEDFSAQATFALLRSQVDVVPALGVPPLLDQLSGFLATDEMSREQRDRMLRGRSLVGRLWEHCETLLQNRTFSVARAAAILWSDQFHLLTGIATSPDMMDRVFAALADLPDVDGRRLGSDADPLVRAALIIGHGPVCPSWPAEAMEDDPSPEVRAAARDMYEAWEYDEPGTVAYRCRCHGQAASSEEPAVVAASGHPAPVSAVLNEAEPAGRGAGILNFHQAMWLAEGESPLVLSADGDDRSGRSDNWGDLSAFVRLLPEAWHARRTDDWAVFLPLVEHLAKLEPRERFSPENRAVYNALNHLLLYAGDGQHPLGALGELLSPDGENELLGGFTANFKRCWYPLLEDMWHWWSGWDLVPHGYAGTPPDWLDEDLGPLNDVPGSVPRGDPIELASHCVAPVGVGPATEPDGTFEPCFVEHEPTVLTLTVPTYEGWMVALRGMKLRGPSIVRVQISEAEPPFGVTLGFWLVQEFLEKDAPYRNHARFLTDAATPAVMSLVREWGWALGGPE